MATRATKSISTMKSTAIFFHFSFSFFSSIACIFLIVVIGSLLSSCSSSQSPVKTTDSASSAASGGVASLAAIPTFPLTLNQETAVVVDNTSAVVAMTSANSQENSVTLSVKVGGGENVKTVSADEVISFGNLRVCVTNITIDQTTGNATAILVPTTSQRASAWYSLATQDGATNGSCVLFSQAIFDSSKTDGAVSFFDDFLMDSAYQSSVSPSRSKVSDDVLVGRAYAVLLGQKLDNLSTQAWEFYVQQNGASKFIETLINSSEFKAREESIK